MIISFNRYNGGGGSGSGVTPQEVQAQIDSALTYYWESGETKDYVDEAVSGISLDGYYTSGETDEAIAQAVAPFYTSAQTEEAIVSKNYVTSAQVETQIEAKNYVNSGDVKTQVEAYNYATVSQIPIVPTSNTAFTNDAGYITDAAIENLVTSAQVKTQIEGYNYVTSGEVETQITNKNYITDQALTSYTPTSGFATVNGSAITNGGNIVIQGGGGGDMSNYWNSAQTKSYVDSAATNLQDQIDTMDEVIADALNDLNGQLVNKVSSSSVSTIWKGTQAEYDLIVSKDPATFYIIVSSN